MICFSSLFHPLLFFFWLAQLTFYTIINLKMRAPMVLYQMVSQFDWRTNEAY